MSKDVLMSDREAGRVAGNGHNVEWNRGEAEAPAEGSEHALESDDGARYAKSYLTYTNDPCCIKYCIKH